MKSLSYLALLIIIALSLQSEWSDALAKTMTGVMVPLYTYPGLAWDALISARMDHQTVPLVAIINPKNGPGDTTNENYTHGIQELQSAGIMVIGYVHTNYTNRDPILVQNDIETYKSWYPQLQGIFFDEMSSVPGDETYYRNLSEYAKSRGFNFTVGNPGTATIPSYLTTVDNVVLHDNPGNPDLNNLGGWHTNYDKKNFSSLSYGVAQLDKTAVKSAANYVGYIYFSNGTDPNPWFGIPPYLDPLMGYVENSSSVSIISSDVLGNQISGFWNEVYISGVKVKSGFTPAKFWLIPGISYLICAGDYQNYIFDHWNDFGSRCQTINLEQNANITSYYNVYSTLNLKSLTINGTDVSGMWSEVYKNNTRQDYGFTPKQYYLLTNSYYVTCIGDYQNYFFDHWENGDTNRCRLVYLDSDKEILAYFKN